MDNVTLIERLAQAEDSEVGEAVESFLRMAARTAFTSALFEEVESLCGKAYQPLADSDYQRAGSAPGRYFFGTDEEALRRPRVRKDGKEVRLKTYEAAQGREALRDAMLRAFMAGMPSREHKRMFKGTSGTSHGEVSRLWQKEGERCIEQLRERDLGKADYVVLMLDGIALGGDLCAVVALGITVEGEKHILDFQIGASENLEVCMDLLNRIEARGFSPRRRLLAVTDGSKPLRKSVRYADDCVVLVDQLSEELKEFIADKLENWMGLRINQEKTSSKQMEQIGTRLDFLGYSLRYDRDLHGRPWNYLNIFPSPKSVKRERAKLRQMTDKKQCFKPVPNLTAELNRHLKGWANYYSHGYPRKVFREINSYARERMVKHLKRRSQRAYKVPNGKSYCKHLEDMGLIYL